jgi:hypothetical protein
VAVLDQAMFAEGWMRLTTGQSYFVTEENTATYWEVLQQLSPAQWRHAVRIASEESDPPKPGLMWPPGKLLAWGRTYVDPASLRLVEPRTNHFATGDPRFPRKPGEEVVAYAERLARHLGHRPGATAVQEMPDVRKPYRDAEEPDEPGSEG